MAVQTKQAYQVFAENYVRKHFGDSAVNDTFNVTKLNNTTLIIKGDAFPPEGLRFTQWKDEDK